MKIERIDHLYDESGLDNVILVGLEVARDDDGETVVTIRNINQLHRSITAALAAKTARLEPRELRFIRTELGLTQAELAERLGKDVQAVGRWERGEHPMDRTAETLLRVLAFQHLDPARAPPVGTIAAWVAGEGAPPIRLDASDPKRWSQLAA